MSSESKTAIEAGQKHYIVQHSSGYVQSQESNAIGSIVAVSALDSLPLATTFEPAPDCFVLALADKPWIITQNDFLIVMRVDLPGVEKQDVKVWISSNELHVNGIRSVGLKSQQCYAHRLPHEADINDVEAELVNGVLSVTFKRNRRPSYVNVVVK